MASIALAAASPFVILGCSMDERGVDSLPVVSDQLGVPTPLTVQLAGSFVRAEGREMPIQSGQVQMAAYENNQLELDGLDLAFGTILVTDEHPSLEGLELRHVRTSLAQPVVTTIEWTACGDAGFATLRADLLLDWSTVAPNGTEIELATQRIEDVEIELDIYSAMDGTLTAVLSGQKRGVIWSWAGLAEVADLDFDLRATRTPNIE
jgi:hypothetical protein